jgi:hypothetical protein
MTDTWTLEIYEHSSDDQLVGVFDFRNKRSLREWCYAHVEAAQMNWDNANHACHVYLGGGTRGLFCV